MPYRQSGANECAIPYRNEQANASASINKMLQTYGSSAVFLKESVDS